MRPRLLGPFDIPILILVGVAAIGVWIAGPGEQGARATAYVNGKPIAWWPLSGSVRRDTVIGDIGAVIVEHGEGSIRIVKAPCPNHVCLKQGKASHLHDQLVCVPSRLVVAIEGDENALQEHYDAVH